MDKNKGKFWESPRENFRSHSENCRFASLMKIEEVNEWSSSDASSIKPGPRKWQYMKKHKRIITESPTLSDDPTIAIFQKFLIKLQKNWSIYDYFLDTAINSRVLTAFVCRPSTYYYKYIHYSNNDKFNKKPRGQSYDEYGLDTANYTYESFEDNFVYSNQTRGRIQEISNSLRHETESSEALTATKPKRKTMKLKSKKTVLNRQNGKISKIFQEMCGGQNILLKSCRLTNFLFKQFIQKKFKDMTENIAKYFDFKSANFEDYLTELDRLLLSREEKLLALCFDAFDFNKDKYICYQDTYMAIEARTEDLYDSDLVKMQSYMEMKKKGVYPLRRTMSKKGRRQSVMSKASDFSVFESKKKDIPPVHPTKPEALTFEDFCRIDFKGKPQLICSLFKHLCCYDVNLCQELLTPVCKTRRPSEELIFSSNFQEIVDKNSLDYYLDLEENMAKFSFDVLKDLLGKFNILRDKKHSLNVITKASMTENWKTLFGHCHEYISERIYYYFSGHLYREVNKSMYLSKIYDFLNDENEQKKFSFEFYDARADKKLTSDEVYRMEQCLPVNSPVQQECSV